MLSGIRYGMDEGMPVEYTGEVDRVMELNITISSNEVQRLKEAIENKDDGFIIRTLDGFEINVDFPDE